MSPLAVAVGALTACDAISRVLGARTFLQALSVGTCLCNCVVGWGWLRGHRCGEVGVSFHSAESFSTASVLQAPTLEPPAGCVGRASASQVYLG